MSISLITPISENKSYTLDDYIRGVLLQDYPPEDIHWVFCIQVQRLDRLQNRLEDLIERLPHRSIELVHCPLPFSDQFFDPRQNILTWKERAQIAAILRGMAIRYALEEFPNDTHVFSLGCDVILNKPDDLSRLLQDEKPLVSGIINARVRHFPLVLHYFHDTHSWEPWINYPKDRLFTTHWTGMDILLMERFVAEQINLCEFDLKKYYVGEDGWFCLEAREKLEIETWVDPFVLPYHVNHDDTVLWAGGEAPRPGIRVRCHVCGLETISVKTYSTPGGSCGRCGTWIYPDPWFSKQETCEPPYKMGSRSA